MSLHGRLIDDADRLWFDNTMDQLCQRHFLFNISAHADGEAPRTITICVGLKPKDAVSPREVSDGCPSRFEALDPSALAVGMLRKSC